ncbi:phospholipase D precursor [Ophiocordyceps camponoti-floridani]|uniref:Phospholipase D n=1 Tax=Ophiocordyceps camponoti-floridani TaxID=2030778 RepID=A0A8H4VG36_9HYPO|nr:phospholipase D precursor [Ophiocordyceps camponoti-floridani]
MKFWCLSALGVFAFAALGSVAVEPATVDYCMSLDPSGTVINFSDQKPETIRRIRKECRKCRQQGECERPELQYDLTYHDICGCLARLRRRPVHVIAGGVTTEERLTWALEHGATAIEMGIGPRDYLVRGWWCEHSRASGDYWGMRVDEFFPLINKKVQEGHYIGFVWLEIAYPDWYDVDKPSHNDTSLVGLIGFVREHLTSVGVPVLFSFASKDEGKAINYTRQHLGPMDAIAMPGDAREATELFKADESPRLRQRVMSHGSWDNVESASRWEETMAAGVRSQAFGRVLTWINIEQEVQSTPDIALSHGVDGIAYGYNGHSYADWAEAKLGAARIKLAICRNNLTRIAMPGDKPW